MNATSIKKRKVGTILEVSLFKNLKIQAAEENRPMAEIIADAIELYLSQTKISQDEARPQLEPIVPSATIEDASGATAELTKYA